MGFVFESIILFLILLLDLLDEVFDLLVGLVKVVGITSVITILEGKLFHKNSIWVSELWELKSSRLTRAWSVEVDPQVSPLALLLLGQVIDGADMERHKLILINWNKNGLILLVNE